MKRTNWLSSEKMVVVTDDEAFGRSLALLPERKGFVLMKDVIPNFSSPYKKNLVFAYLPLLQGRTECCSEAIAVSLRWKLMQSDSKNNYLKLWRCWQKKSSMGSQTYSVTCVREWDTLVYHRWLSRMHNYYFISSIFNIVWLVYTVIRDSSIKCSCSII